MRYFVCSRNSRGIESSAKCRRGLPGWGSRQGLGPQQRGGRIGGLRPLGGRCRLLGRVSRGSALLEQGLQRLRRGLREKRRARRAGRHVGLQAIAGLGCEFAQRQGRQLPGRGVC